MCEWAGAHTCTGHRDVTVPADHLKDKAPLKSNHQQDIKTKPEKSPASLKKKQDLPIEKERKYSERNILLIGSWKSRS